MAFRIETDEEEYRLIGPGGEVGPEIEYGCHAVVDVDGVLHFALIGADPDATEAEVFAVSMDGPPVLIESAACEDVHFGDETEDEDEEEDEEEDDEDILIPLDENA